MSIFYERFLRLCANAKKSPSGVAAAIGLSNAAATGWKNGKQPSDTTLYKLAEYFGVSTDYLKGEEEQKENPGIPKDAEVDEVTMELLNIVQNGSDDDRRDLLEMYKLLKRRETR